MGTFDRFESIRKKLSDIEGRLSDVRKSVGGDYYTKSEIDAFLAAQDALSEMGDVNITAPVDAAPLEYDIATGKWIDGTPGGTVGYGLDIIDENFNSLANGDINGQGVYGHAGTWAVTAAAGTTCEVIANPADGKMLRLHDVSVANAAMCHLDIDTGYELILGIWELKVKINLLEADSRGYFFLMEQANPANYFGFYFKGDDSHLYYSDGGAVATDYGAIAVDTWYTIRLFFDLHARRCTAWKDGSVLFWYEAINSPPRHIDRILFLTRDIHSGVDFDIDDLLLANLNRKAE